MEKIIIAQDFSDAPGARYRTDGPKSGQEFYEDLLKPKFDLAKSKNVKLFIDLDNTWGYASSFISESFGKLAIVYDPNTVMKNIEFKSDDEPLLIEKIKHLIIKQASA